MMNDKPVLLSELISTLGKFRAELGDVPVYVGKADVPPTQPIVYAEHGRVLIQ